MYMRVNAEYSADSSGPLHLLPHTDACIIGCQVAVVRWALLVDWNANG